MSVIAVDVPAATDIYESALGKFEDAGLKLEVVPVALGVADMSSQAQQINTSNPDGVLSIVGHDAFCIPALNALNSLGYQGTLTTISFCITDAMREAIPADLLDGMVIAAAAPIGDAKDPSMQQWAAVLDHYGGQARGPRAIHRVRSAGWCQEA